MTKILCRKCGEIVGEVVTIEDIPLLRVGGLLVNQLSAACDHCGSEFFWNSAGYKFNRIIREWKEREGITPPKVEMAGIL